MAVEILAPRAPRRRARSAVASDGIPLSMRGAAGAGPTRFSFLDRQVLSILAEPVRKDLHLTDSELGLLTGFAFALFYTLFGVPIAWLADRSHRVRIVALACATWEPVLRGGRAGAQLRPARGGPARRRHRRGGGYDAPPTRSSPITSLPSGGGAALALYSLRRAGGPGGGDRRWGRAWRCTTAGAWPFFAMGPAGAAGRAADRDGGARARARRPGSRRRRLAGDQGRAPSAR